MEIKDFNLMKSEIKSYSPYTGYDIFNTIRGHSGNYLSSQQAYWLWSISDAVGDACDRISWAFEQLTPVLYDSKTNEFVTEHPVLELINNPGYEQSSDRFQFELMTSYLTTGEAYPLLIGNVKYEPIELQNVKACDVELLEGANGHLYRIIKTDYNKQEEFTREEIKNRKMFVYWKSDQLKEMAQIINSSRKNNIQGQSVLERIYYQALTKYYGNVHNAGMLENASRPSGILSPKEAINDQKNYEAYKNEVHNNLTGSVNVGRLITPPIPIEYQNLILNPRDMDFINLIENSRVEIYNQYQIPLPLINTKTQTFNNYETAIGAFYDMSVTPRAKFMYKQLGKFILPRYKDGERFTLTINEKEIPALKNRMFESIKKMRETYVFSDNEMRTVAGYESIGDDGDAIYKPSNLAPSGQNDDYILDNIRLRETERLESEQPVNEEEEDEG